MRFKIRSLLITTALIAVLIAIFTKPYLDSTTESTALERMEKEWALLVDDAAFLGNKESLRRADHWTEWPARKLFGDQSMSRIRKLRIVGPKNKRPTFKDLAAFDYVTHCEFNYHRQQTYQLDSEACRYIGQIKNLQDLVLGPTLVDGLVHLRNLPLKRLICGGPDWTQAEFDAIGSIQSLEMIQLSTNRFEPANLAAFSNLNNLKHLVLTTGYNEDASVGTIQGLSEIASLPSLRNLTLFGRYGAGEIKTLTSMSQLTSISLRGASFHQTEIQNLRHIENLKYASFGHMDISVESYDILDAAGIEVEHYGLTGAELSKEYFAYNEIYYPADSKKSKITAWCSPDSDSCTINILVCAAPKPRHDWSANQPPQIEFYGFEFAGDWRELVGATKSVTTDWNDVDADQGNFYDGIHTGTNNHEIKFVSREGNMIRVKWSCRIGDSGADSVPGLIDAHIPFTTVYVSNRMGETTIEEAKQAVAKIFALQDFQEPVYSGRNNSLIAFEAKIPASK